jgi:beta-N-acetylglucosaminidase
MTGPNTGRNIYNLYGIAAFNDDGSRYQARKYAEDNGWFSMRDGIIGGAQFIAEGYISQGQNTLYKMRWDFPNCSHQYATDVSWAVKQTETIGPVYDSFDESVRSKFVFDIPVYQA